MGGFVRQQLDAFLFVFFFGELSGSTRTEATRTSPLARCFPNSLGFLRSSWATCLFRFFLSSGRWEATEQHPLQSLSARVNIGEHSEFCFFLSLRFVQFRIFLFDDLLGTVKLQS